MKSSHPTLQLTANIPDEFDSVYEHRALAFEYYANSYAMWLEGADDFPEPTQELEERYGKCFWHPEVPSADELVQLEKSKRFNKNSTRSTSRPWRRESS